MAEKTPQELLMYEAGSKSLEHILEGSEILALGAGRTVLATLEAIFDNYDSLIRDYSSLVKEGQLTIVCVSEATYEYGRKLLDRHPDLEGKIRFTQDISEIKGKKATLFDGADQIAGNVLVKGGRKVYSKEKQDYGCKGLKGREGCMAEEKEAFRIVAENNGRIIVVADDQKPVNYLGENGYPVGVEVDNTYREEAEDYIVQTLLMEAARQTGITLTRDDIIREYRTVTEENPELERQEKKIPKGEEFSTIRDNPILDIYIGEGWFNDYGALERALEDNEHVVASGLFAIVSPQNERDVPDVVVIAHGPGNIVVRNNPAYQ